ncbi:MAG: beta-galactosidase [Victivallales bacterium]|nr:beta-galactosidase [Victivallales bacterium]
MSTFAPPYFGSDYYPEDWPAEQLSEDIAKMKEAGFNVARIAEFAWSRMEPSDGVFEFGWLHRVVDELGKAGIATILGTPTATPPVWLLRKYPGVTKVLEQGNSLEHGGRRHCCFRNPIYLRYCLRIAEKMAQEFGNDPNVIGWQIDNEVYVHDRGCFCPVCAEQFRRHLEKKFNGDIDALNRAWNLTVFSQEYSSFDEINPPRNAWTNPHINQEWILFQQHAVIEFVHAQADVLHRYVGSVPVGTDTMPYNGLDYAELSSRLDIAEFNHYNTPNTLWEVILWFDFVRNYRNRPFWNTETQTTWNGSHIISQTLKPEGYCTANSWLPIALGGEANLYWLWRTHWGGHELMHGAVLAASGRPMHTFGEVQEISRGLRKAADFINGTRVVSDIAVHYPSRSLNLFLVQGIHKEFHYTRCFADSFYRPLLDECCRPDLLETSQDFSQHKLLVSPYVCYLEPELAKRILDWVANGGIWIVGPMTDIRDEHGAKFQDRPLGCLEELLNVRWCYSVPDAELTLKCAWKDGSPFQSGVWNELYEANGDGVLAQITQSPHSALLGKAVLLERKIGRGHVFLLGTTPSREMMRKVYERALDLAGIPYGNGDGENIVVVPRQGEKLSGQFLVEFAGQGGIVTLPKPGHDLLTGEDFDTTVPLAPYQVRVIQF